MKKVKHQMRKNERKEGEKGISKNYKRNWKKVKQLMNVYKENQWNIEVKPIRHFTKTK